MSKSNRLLDMVFGDIVETSEKISLYDRFQAADNALGITTTGELEVLKKSYQNILDMVSDELEALAYIEERIIQLRCRAMIKTELKLILIRGYIYARTTFYRKGNAVKDIRVLVGQTTEYGEDLEALYNSPKFIQLAIDKLTVAIDKELDQNERASQFLQIKYA